MDKSREQFEEWAQSNRFNVERLNDCNGNDCKWYANAATDMQWDAWQASRAALMVELPAMPVNAKECAKWVESVIKSISDCGIKIKCRR